MEQKTSIWQKLYFWLIIAFFYLPIIYVVFFSFNSSKSLTNFTGFSLRWYEKMFESRPIMEAIWYTIACAVIATAVSTVVGTITAIGLSKSRKTLREAINQVNNLPMLNPDIVTAIGFMLFFTSIRVKTGFTTMVLAHIAFCIPYVILSVMPKLRTLDPNMAEAALDLGCTPMQALWKVIMPQIKTGIISGALVAFSMSFDDFVISLFTTGPGVSNISIYVYSNVKRINPTINALSSIIVLLITTVLIIVNVVPIVRERKKAKQQELIGKEKLVEGPTKRSLTWIKLVVAAALAITVFTVVKNRNTADKPVDAMAMFGCDTLNVYNAGEYIADETVPAFEEKYNAKVNYDTFESNEIMYTKLLGGLQFDVLIPSDYMIERLIKEDMLQPLDKNVVTNLSSISPEVMDVAKVFDPNEEYAAPYFYGSVGLVYNKNNVDSALIEEEGWNILHDSRFKGRVYAYDSQRDMFMIALKALGYSMNTDNPEQLTEAYNWLLEMNEDITPSYVTDQIIDGMVNGEMDIAVMYSGDAAYVISENEDMAYIEPGQGTNVWLDAMVIPANSACPALANEFINYMLSDEVAEQNSKYVGYTSPNAEVRDTLSSEGGTYDGNEAYLPRSGYEKDEVFRFNEALTKKLGELYTKVKMSMK